MWMPVSKKVLADAEGMRADLNWSMEAHYDYLNRPNTEEEERIGWREFTDSAGGTGRYAVGWRAEQERKEAEARRESEMAACPYVACTCGHHEG